MRELRHFTEHAFVAENLSKETLEEIGIQNCDTVIIGIGEKIDTSILTTLKVVSLNVPHVIAKAISRDQGAVLEKIGAEVVYPEHDMALRLANRLVSQMCIRDSSCFMQYSQTNRGIRAIRNRDNRLGMVQI